MANKRSLWKKALYLLIAFVLMIGLAIPMAVAPVVADDIDSATPPAGYTPVPAVPGANPQSPAYWAIIKDVNPWGVPVNEMCLTDMGIAYDVINTADLATTDLGEYHKIIIASDQTDAAYVNLAACQQQLSAWVAGGGILIAHAADQGWNLGTWGASFLPGMETHVGNVDNTLEPTAKHPVLKNISDEDLDGWNFSTHGYFQGLNNPQRVSGAAKIIVSDTFNNAIHPTYMEYGHGLGLVLATMQTVEFPYVAAGAGSGATKELLPNEIKYALNSQQGLALVPSIAYDVLGSMEQFDLRGVPAYPVEWRFVMGADLTDYNVVAGGEEGDRFVVVEALSVGELHIYVDVDVDLDGVVDETLHAEKKWGEIHRTDLKVSAYWDPTGMHDAAPGQDSSEVVWIENEKRWLGGVILDETVYGLFRQQWGSPDAQLVEHAAGHAVVHWWALDDDANLAGVMPPNCPDDPKVLIDRINTLPRSATAVFGVPGDGTYTTTTSGPDGFTSVPLVALAEGRVLIVLVAEYPVDFHGQHTVCPEVVRWNFYTQQLEKVPQVRWAGEQIILEKYFGESYAGNLVKFVKEAQSPGGLDSLNGESDFVYTLVGCDGVARASYICEDQGEVDVDAVLYASMVPDDNILQNPDTDISEVDPAYAAECCGIPINKHGFVVFYLKLEGVTLGNVEGKRMGHNSGLWTPENPWDTGSDVLEETLNVSEDTLLRARVKGWFIGDNMSVREAGWIDTNGNGVKDPGDQLLPAGRWVLPDDWEYLAGPNWEELRPRWDIMDQPNDTITAPTELGPYDGVANPPVIGPYNSLDDYNPGVLGRVWADPMVGDGRKTIVPNEALNWWDAPMPPAKLVFKITDGVGFFKEADKGDIYYEDAIRYTNPFYSIEVPASPLIAPFVNNGGYDWDSWGWNIIQGPYDFWHIFNYLPNADVPAEDSMHPTKVEVYTDNHGEAMVYLNGDANLNLPENFVVDPGTVVGTTTVKAIADYPYLRKHASVDSNTVEKTWTWGKEIAIRVRQIEADFARKMVLIYVTDRDGQPVYGERVDWSFDSAAGLIDQILTPSGWEVCTGQIRDVSTMTQPLSGAECKEYMNPMTGPTSGFMDGTMQILDEAQFYNECRHGVTGIVVYRSELAGVNIKVTLHEREGIITKDVYLNFAYLSPTDPVVDLVAGQWNEMLFMAPTEPIESVLSTIPDDVEVTVWSASGQGYNSTAPAWANDLSEFTERATYYIWVSKDATLVYGD